MSQKFKVKVKEVKKEVCRKSFHCLLFCYRLRYKSNTFL